MSLALRVRSLVLLSVLALTGCTSARVVSRDPTGGVVAIPENSNSWPSRYRDQAIALIKQDCPDYAIVREEEVVTGTVTTDRDSTDTRTRDLAPKAWPLGGTATSTDVTHTRETQNRTEWRITYRKATPPATIVQTASSPLARPYVQPAVAMTPAAASTPGAASLPPQPLPIGQ
jgi:hypothetical protein